MRNPVRVISLIGRPNVGKSTIYNRLMGNQHLNITYDRPGVTRDRHYGRLPLEALELTFEERDQREDERDPLDELNGESASPASTDPILYLVDTGGFYPDLKDQLQVHEVNHQGPRRGQQGESVQFLTEEEKRRRDLFQRMGRFAEMSIDESDLVLLVVDAREGLSPFDELILESIRRHQRDFLVLVNKVDSAKQDPDVGQFYALGVGEENLVVISAAHGKGFGDLKEKLGEFLQKWRDQDLQDLQNDFQDEQRARLAKGLEPREQVIGTLSIVGAPNVGKSTLLNKLLGTERALVAPVPGTTVDPIHGYFDLYFGPKALELFSEKASPEREQENWPESELEASGQEMPEQLEFEGEQAVEQEAPVEAQVGEEAKWEGDEINPTEGEARADMDPLPEGEELQGAKESPKGSYWRSVRIVDTAGIRKKKLITEFVESQSVYRALRSVDESDVVLYLVDATKGLGHQDARLCDVILEKGKSLILCFNKIDCVEKEWKDNRSKREWWEKMTMNIPWLDFCQVLPLSAKTGDHLKTLREAIKKTLIIRNRKIPTGRLNQCVHQLVEKNPIIPKHSHGKRLKIKYVSMVKSGPPTFLMFSNLTENIPPHYRRYLVNGLRKEFGLVNTPVHLIFRSGSDAASVNS